MDASEVTQLAEDFVVRRISAIRVRILTAKGKKFRGRARLKVLAPGIKDGQQLLTLKRAPDGSYYSNKIVAGECRVVINVHGSIPSDELPASVREGEICELGEIRIFPNSDAD